MPHSLEVETPNRGEDCPKAWKSFLQAHCNELFQTALLLSADPEDAEASIAATLNSIDLSKPPSESEYLVLQERLAMRTIESTRRTGSPKIAEARDLLQGGLQPVLLIERSPRLCFVLRTLLGYATSSCAQMLGMEESAVRTYLRIAVLQLHNTVAGTGFQSCLLDEHLNAQVGEDCPAIRPLMSNAAAAHC